MSEPPLPGRRLDPLLIALIATAVYVLHGYDGALDHDLGVFTYGGQQLADGVPPYVGIFNSVGPLSDLLPGLAIAAGRVVGVGPVLAERLLFTALSVGCCVLVCVLARDAFRSRAAGWIAPAVFLTFGTFLVLASDGPREKTTMVLFLLATLILLGRRRWLAAGACTALATLAWQPVLAVAVCAAVVTVLSGTTRRARAAAAYVLGGIVPTGLAIAGFAARGDLHTAVDGFLVVNALDTRQPSLFARPDHTATFLWHGYHVSLVLAVVGLVALLGLALRRLAGREVDLVVALGAAGLVAAAWTSYAINGAPDLFVVLPFAALGLGGAVVAVADRLSAVPARALVAAVTVTAVGLSGAEAIARHTDTLRVQSADVAAVLASAPPGATLLSLDAPQVLALAGRTNPTPYQLFDKAMQRYLDQNYPGGLTGYAQQVVRIDPTLIATSPRGLPRWAWSVLRPHYRRLGRGPNWTWYVARPAARRVEGPVAAPCRHLHRVAPDGRDGGAAYTWRP